MLFVTVYIVVELLLAYKINVNIDILSVVLFSILAFGLEICLLSIFLPDLSKKIIDNVCILVRRKIQ